ncbi:MAG: hypothetical protein ACRCS9_05975 [Hyphomicrobium sp.]
MSKRYSYFTRLRRNKVRVEARRRPYASAIVDDAHASRDETAKAPPHPRVDTHQQLAAEF